MVAKNESTDSELIFVVVVVVVLCFPFFVFSVLLSSINTATVLFTLKVDKQGHLGCLPFTQTTGVEILCRNIKFDMVGEQPAPKYIQISYAD